MNASYAIRPAVPADVPGIISLMRELAEYEKLTHMFAATDASLQQSLFGEQPPAECLVAEMTAPSGARILVGYAVWFHNYSTFLCKHGLYLEDVYVQADKRGLGIGRSFLQRLAAIAVERDCGRFEWTVLDWNQPAIDFYQGMGAQLLPEWRIVRVTGDALLQMGAAQGDASAQANSADGGKSTRKGTAHG